MKPFLKWAGNKYQIIESIKQVLPAGKRLIEPFVGSGATFLNIDFSHYFLADTNSDLIHLFNTLKKEGIIFIEYCKTFFLPQNNTAKKFYEFRQLFNETRDVRLKSALFVYLNKHCFNGLCRYNSTGQFNTPFGKYIKPYFPAKEMEYFYFRSINAEFKISDFIATMASAEKGDVIYCDPPYVPLTDTANFTNYSAGGFDLTQQKKLAEIAIALAKRGAKVVVSNHDTAFTQELYRDAEIIYLEVKRTISCDATNRKKTKELLAVFA